MAKAADWIDNRGGRCNDPADAVAANNLLSLVCFCLNDLIEPRRSDLTLENEESFDIFRNMPHW